MVVWAVAMWKLLVVGARGLEGTSSSSLSLATPSQTSLQASRRKSRTLALTKLRTGRMWKMRERITGESCSRCHCCAGELERLERRAAIPSPSAVRAGGYHAGYHSNLYLYQHRHRCCVPKAKAKARGARQGPCGWVVGVGLLRVRLRLRYVRVRTRVGLAVSRISRRRWGTRVVRSRQRKRAPPPPPTREKRGRSCPARVLGLLSES